MGDMPIGKLLRRLSPPVMLALLIQSVYNIVDSYFVAQYSLSGLTALSLVFPIQLLATALATGAGTGLGILIARMDGSGNDAAQRDAIQSGLWLGVFNFILFAGVGLAVLQGYFALSSDQPAVRQQGIQYARVVLAGSLGLFVESHCTKLLQARGNTLVPMLAQVTGAAVNMVLDPILIFGRLGAPAMGVTGAALATVVGQWAAMAITLGAVCRSYDLTGRVRLRLCAEIYRCGLAPIAMQSLNTFYIVGLNLILKQFTEDAVTVLGLYYKLQTFFFIPLMGLQQVIVPVVSFNHSAGAEDRVRETLRWAVGISEAVMAAATAVFLLAPQALLRIFSASPAILETGVPALRIICLSFLPAGVAMMLTVFFQGSGQSGQSIFITVLRQVVLLVPLAWVFHFAGLTWVWLTFPVTEVLSLLCALAFYRGVPFLSKRRNAE